MNSALLTFFIAVPVNDVQDAAITIFSSVDTCAKGAKQLTVNPDVCGKDRSFVSI